MGRSGSLGLNGHIRDGPSSVGLEELEEVGLWFTLEHHGFWDAVQFLTTVYFCGEQM